MKVNNTNYETVVDLLEQIAIDTTHVKTILEMLINGGTSDLSTPCLDDLINICHDYIYKVDSMVNETINKVDYSTKLKERKEV